MKLVYIIAVTTSSNGFSTLKSHLAETVCIQAKPFYLNVELLYHLHIPSNEL